VVKLLPGVLSALFEHLQAQQQRREEVGGRWNEQGFVFTNELGEPLERHNLAHRHLRKILEEAGLPQIRLCDLRHPATRSMPGPKRLRACGASPVTTA
jgi:hypothetical protein